MPGDGARCPYGADCLPRRRAPRPGTPTSSSPTTLLAIDALAEASVLPEHNYVVVDEAHELVDRVTSVATGELTPAPLGDHPPDHAAGASPADPATGGGGGHLLVGHPRRQAGPHRTISTTIAATLTRAAERRVPRPRRHRPSPPGLKAAAARTGRSPRWPDRRHYRRGCWTRSCPRYRSGPMLSCGWIGREPLGGSTRPVLRVAPLSVAGLLLHPGLRGATTVLTSGDPDHRWIVPTRWPGPGAWRRHPVAWSGRRLAVHAKSGILCVAAHLPPPSRGGPPDPVRRIAALIGRRAGAR